MMYAEDFGTARRYTILKLIIIGIIGVLFVRLYMLQLFSHEEYGKESEKNLTMLKEAAEVEQNEDYPDLFGPKEV